MLCNPLHDHLYALIYVVEQPDCTCGHMRENNKHVLIDSVLYSNEQNQMITELNRLGFQPLLNNLLYGTLRKQTKKHFGSSNSFVKTLKGLLNQCLVNHS